MKKKILFLIKIPPPVTGATLINKQVLECINSTENFIIQSISISYKVTIGDISAFSLRKIFKIQEVCLKLIKSLIQFKPQVVYFQISPLGLAFLRDCIYIALIKLFRRHILFHMHGKGINEVSSHSNLQTKIYTWAFKNSSLICLSESMTNDIARVYKGIPFIVNNGIQVIEFEEKKEELINCLEILFLSNLIYSKGILDYLDSIKILKQKPIKKDFRGIIIGEEVELNADTLNNEIVTRGLSGQVHYIGSKFNLEKYEKLREAYVLVYPTYNDSFPLTILEAMQVGLPVITTNEGGIPDIIDDGVTGFLVDRHRPDQIAEKLNILIENPELRRSIGEAGKNKFMKYYTLDIFTNNMKDVFEDIIAKLD